MQKMQITYTPTTEEVRGAYEGQLIKVGNNAYQLLDEAHAKAEFDRWLAEVKAEERERIIALLEERYSTLMEIVSDCAPEGDSQHIMMDALNDANNLERIIALIKGEEQ